MNTIDSPIFNSWFAGSKVVDKNGEPKICYHSSRGFDSGIREFKPFTHFGTLNAASSRIYRKSGLGNIKPSRFNKSDKDAVLNQLPAIYPVFLSIKKPILFKDDIQVNHGPLDYINILFDNGLVSDQQRNKFVNLVLFKRNKPEPFYYKYILEIMNKHGFDGFVYKNTVEHKNSISWVITSPDQVWSIFQ